MQLTIEPKHAVLNTRPTPKVMAVLPQIEGRRFWLKPIGLKIEATEHNLRILSSLPGVVVEDRRASSEVAAEVASEFDLGIAQYTPKTKPMPHQKQALEKARPLTAFGLFMEQGTGKSKVQIDWAGELYTAGQITGVIVVSKKGPHRQWIESEIPRHLNCSWSGDWWPFKVPKLGEGLQWLAFNYDGIKSPRGLKAATEFAEKHKGKLLIIGDESQEIKNARSQRHKAMTELKPYSSHRTLSTGTPVAADLTDEWAQLKWLSEDILGIRYITAFRAEYCIMGGFEGRSVVGHKNWERFRKYVDPYTFRATKEELGLLPKQFSDWHFDLNKDQKKMIADLKRDLRSEFGDGAVTAQTAAVAAMKFQQIASGFYITEEGECIRLMPWNKNPRIEALKEWLDFKEGKKVIIWCRFREDFRIITDALRAWGETFVEYHGGVKDKDRKEAIDSFMSETGARIFLANEQSAGTGLNLQGLCTDALYYSHTDNSINRWQSEDRIHRIGTIGACEYTNMVGKGSMDRRMLNRTARKKGVSDLAINPVEDMLAFLAGEADPEAITLDPEEAEADAKFASEMAAALEEDLSGIDEGQW